MGTRFKKNLSAAGLYLPVVIAVLGLLLPGSGCVEKKMSVKEARFGNIDRAITLTKESLALNNGFLTTPSPACRF